jgi:D-sedoheptulose 7-phosphate isomerase
MLLNSYKIAFQQYFEDPAVAADIAKAVGMLKGVKKLFFIGNGGSNSICSHMYEDFGKMARFQTFAFSDAALITCYANDYGYENAMAEWLKLYIDADSILIAVSSSGNSMNIINAVRVAKAMGTSVIGLSGFKPDNKLKTVSDLSFYIPSSSYGIVESYHQVILHIILDEYMETIK